MLMLYVWYVAACWKNQWTNIILSKYTQIMIKGVQMGE